VRKTAGRTTLITGATSGIGAAVARAVLARSAAEDRVYVNYAHRQEAAERFAAGLDDAGRGKLTFLRADLSTYEGLQDLKEAFLKSEAAAGREPSLDWLVLNTGISTKKPYEEYTFEEWNRILNTNLSVPAFAVRELRPFLREGGSVLFMGSYAGRQAYSSSLVYGVSKAGVHFLARSLVKELEPMQVRVNAIAPGFTQTPWHEDRSPESYERIERKIALHRFAKPEEIARMAVEILSNTYMNGSVVDIHGGYDYF